MNFCHTLILANHHFNHGSPCSRSLHPYQLPGLPDVQSKNGLPSWSGTYGKQLIMLCVIWNLIILFTAPQPEVETVAHTGSDPYYGHEHSAHLCACFIMHLFACDGYHTTLYGLESRFTYFIAHALYQMKLHLSVTFTALLLLQCLKIHFPTTRGSSCWHLFIAAFMVTSKVMSSGNHGDPGFSS